MNTEMENGTQMTLEECVPMISQKQTVGASDSHAKTSQLQESNLDFKETVQACFSELCTLSDSSKKKINPLTFSLRTLRICLVLMEDGISPDCSLKWSRGGYDAEWKVLNSKDFGVPQNRERCFIVGHLRGRSSSKVFPIERTDGENSVSIIGHRDGYRRNTQVFSQEGITEALDTGQGGGRCHHVEIPCFIDLSYQKSELTNKARCLQARYNKEIANHKAEVSGVAIPVLTPDRAEKRQNGRRFKDDSEPMFTLTSQDRHGVETSVPVSMTRNIVEEEIEVAHCLNANDSRKFFGKNQRGNAVMKVLGCIDPQGRKTKKVAPRNEVPTLRSQSHGNDPNICVKVAEATKQEYAECRVGVYSVNLSVPGSATRRGMVGHSIANTLDTRCNQGIFVKVSDELIVYAIWYEKYQCYIAIRKLTPKECFRLQGWSDDYFDKAQFVNSDSQLYKQAGNGVTVNVIQEIAERMKINDAERIS